MLFNQIGKFPISNFNGINAPPSEDRYAALKDLDSLMKKTQLKEDTQNNSNNCKQVKFLNVINWAIFL